MELTIEDYNIAVIKELTRREEARENKVKLFSRITQPIAHKIEELKLNYREKQLIKAL